MRRNQAEQSRTRTRKAQPMFASSQFRRAAIAAMAAAAVASSSNAGAAAATVSAPAASAPNATSGPFATKATVEIEDAHGPVQLNRNEQVAYMFLSAIEVI
jgi:hypothetical protein